MGHITELCPVGKDLDSSFSLVFSLVSYSSFCGLLFVCSVEIVKRVLVEDWAGKLGVMLLYLLDVLFAFVLVFAYAWAVYVSVV